MMIEPSDEELMARTGAGDRGAFESLVCRHQARVLNLVFRIVGDRGRASDLTQEVFLKTWTAAAAYEPTAKFTTWIYRVTTNVCLNDMKRARRQRWLSFFGFGMGDTNPLEETVADRSPSPEALLLGKERSRQIADALQSLPENQRTALILKRYDGLSYQEIAGILGCSVSAVESLLVRAKKNLREKMKIIDE
jgi:RNA polymerase sigma-70 factor, ECF subfamily